MEINSSNIYLLIACCTLPFCTVLVIILAMSIKERWEYGKKLLENLRNKPNDMNNLLPVPARYLPAYIIASLIVVGSLLCISVITLAYYLGFPLFSNINTEIFGLISLIILLFALLITLVGLLFNRIHKTKK